LCGDFADSSVRYADVNTAAEAERWLRGIEAEQFS
jgi:hypothetical protein